MKCLHQPLCGCLNEEWRADDCWPDGKPGELTADRIEYWREQLAGQYSKLRPEMREEITHLCDMALRSAEKPMDDQAQQRLDEEQKMQITLSMLDLAAVRALTLDERSYLASELGLWHEWRQHTSVSPGQAPLVL